jgi:hypothetical protein
MIVSLSLPKILSEFQEGSSVPDCITGKGINKRRGEFLIPSSLFIEYKPLLLFNRKKLLLFYIE